jgi:hypothetical protein
MIYFDLLYVYIANCVPKIRFYTDCGSFCGKKINIFLKFESFQQQKCMKLM